MGRAYTPSLRGVKRKPCRFCEKSDLEFNYKNPQLLVSFITERGKIIPSRITGVCAKHQRALKVEIKRARTIALLPYTTNHS